MTEYSSEILYVVTCVLQVLHTQTDYFCPRRDTWILWASQDRSLCYSYRSAAPYLQALRHCHKDESWLLSLHTDYSTNEREKNVAVNLLSTHGANSIWHGFHIRDGRLQEDNFPMTKMPLRTFSERAKRIIPWMDTEFQFQLNDELSCFAIALNCEFQVNHTSREHDNFRGFATHDNAQSDCKNPTFIFRTKSCLDDLPFVCVKPAKYFDEEILRLSNTANLCHNTYFGIDYIGLCIGLETGLVNHEAARYHCRQRGGMLYQTHSAVLSGILDSLLPKMFENYHFNNFDSGLPEAWAWLDYSSNFMENYGTINHTNKQSQCPVLYLGDMPNGTTSLECSRQLRYFICQVPMTHPDVYFPPQVTISPSLISNAVTNIPGSNDRQLAFSMVFTDSRVDRNIFLSCAYHPEVVQDRQMLTLVKAGLPVAESRDELPMLYVLSNGEDSLKDVIRSYVTDYYSCIINNLHTGMVERSGRLFVRMQEVELYAASIHLIVPDKVRRNLILLKSLLRELNQAYPQRKDIPFTPRILRFHTSHIVDRLVVDFQFYNIYHDDMDDIDRKFNFDLLVSNLTLTHASRSISYFFHQNPKWLHYSYDVASLVVRSVDICEWRTVYDPVVNETLNVPDTALGRSFTSRVCLSNGLPHVKLRCVGDKMYGAYWSDAEVNLHCAYRRQIRSKASSTLLAISLSDVNQLNLEASILDTENAIRIVGKSDLVPLDVVLIADIIQKAVVPDHSLSKAVAERIIHLLDVIISVDEQTLIDSNIIGNATNRIFKAIDKMGDYILMQNSSKAFIFSPSVAMVIWDLNAEEDNISVGLQLTVDKKQSENELKYDNVITLYESENISYSCMDAAIYLPEEFIHHAKRVSEQSDRRVRLTFSVFISNALFRNGQLENSSGESAVNVSLNGKVVAARLSVDGDAVTNLTGGAITTVFSPITALSGRTSGSKIICVYWDFSASSGRGAWSSEGCRQAKYQEDCNVCECSHLTNFAVLMNVYGQDGAAASHDRPLSVITVVGLSLSIAGLFATMMSFLCIGKLRKLRPQQILFNMALSMLVSWVVFLAGFTRTGDYWLCLGVAILLHYFILASFMWMLMEGLLQYLMLVKVLHVIGERFIQKAALTAWGFPLLPVGILLAIDPSQYRGGDTYCWMQLTSFYFSFLLPVTAVILINIVVYGLVISSLCCRQNVGFNKSNLKGVGVRSSVACFIVLGLSWSFAFFAIGEARIVFQYLFTVTCASQGFFVFLMFTARDPTVRSYWLNVLCCCLQRRKAQRGDPSSKRHRASKHDKEQSGLSSNVTMTTRIRQSSSGGGSLVDGLGQLERSSALSMRAECVTYGPTGSDDDI